MSRFYWIYSLMLVGAAFLAALSGCPSLYALPPTQGRLWGSLAAAGLLSFAAIRGSVALARVPWFRRMAALLKRLLTHPELLGPELDTSRALPIAAYSALGEEAFFRGFVQPWLILRCAALLGQPPDELAPVACGVLVASVLFGLVHFPVLEALRPWTLFAVLAGLGFGVLAAASGSLIAPVIAHFLINWRNLVWLARSEVEPLDLDELLKPR
ncbi:MAG: lysostaphin resistance A-like protein [Planctomycetota bacterium]